MALAEAARFATLYEAEIACATLRACGFAALVFDRNLAANLWTQQFALSGIRVMTPVEELAEARAVLSELRPNDPEVRRWGHSPGRFSGLPLAIISVLLTDGGGWALAGLRRRFSLLGALIVFLYSVPYWIFWVIGPMLQGASTD